MFTRLCVRKKISKEPIRVTFGNDEGSCWVVSKLLSLGVQFRFSFCLQDFKLLTILGSAASSFVLV